MKDADYKKAQELSSQLAGLGLRPKAKIVKKVPQRARPSPFKFNYEALKIKDGRDGKDAVAPSEGTLRAIIEPLVKQHLESLKAPAMPEITSDVVKEIVRVMHSLPEQDKLEVSKGIRNHQAFIYKGTKYGMEEMMHGGSSSSGSSSTTTTEYVLTAVQSGADVTINLTQLAHWTNFTNLIQLTRNNVPQTMGASYNFTISGSTLTVFNADAGEIFNATYAYSS